MGLLRSYQGVWRRSCVSWTLTTQLEKHKKKWCTESSYQSGWHLLTASSIHWDGLFYPFSATRVPTPPKPELLPDHKNLYLQCLPIIIHAEQPVLRVSWIVQMLVIFLARASTTSQGLPCMVPTFRDAICSLNLFCRISHDIDLTGPTWTPTLPLTAPHQVLVLLFF